LLSPKVIIRALWVVVPLIIGLLVTAAVTNVLLIKSECTQLEGVWKEKDPIAKKAIDVRTDMNVHIDMQNEMKGWSNTHSHWREELAMLRSVVPDTIQLTSLLINQTIVHATPPSRNFILALDGKAFGDDAVDKVQWLKSTLETNAYFVTRIRKVEVPLFGADRATGASKTDRQFRLLCTYQERAFQ
jgi:hypothetical protein